jgi:hypothetical protein
MVKKPKAIVAILVFGILISLVNILPAISGGYAFLAVSLITIILSFGVFMLREWARVAFIIFAILFFCVYGLLLIAAFQHAYHGYAGMACIFNFPLLLLSLFVIVTLSRKKIKLLFKVVKP